MNTVHASRAGRDEDRKLVFLALAVYLDAESIVHLIHRHKPENSTGGILFGMRVWS